MVYLDVTQTLRLNENFASQYFALFVSMEYRELGKKTQISI